jgi:SAM-dependent methyltransferase
MKRCLRCYDIYQQDNECLSCGAMIEIIDGFESFSPEHAIDGKGFKIESFAYLANLEEKSFWFRARNRLIIFALEKFAPDFKSFLEIGCGTGFVLSGIAKKFKNVNLYGSELFSVGLSYAVKRLPFAKLMQMDARNIPFVNEFDCIGAFDVLEHIEEDELVLKNIYNALGQNGMLFLTVPQHPSLWSATDELACHVRRYTSVDLNNKLKKAGFKIIMSTSFVSTLLPMMYISRMLNKLSKKKNVTGDLELPKLLNYFFEKILNFEVFLIKQGICFPIGGSRFIVAKK